MMHSSAASGPQFITLLAGHNLWATGYLLDDAANLSDEQFHRRFAIGLGSMHDTFRHIIGAMGRWADRIAGKPLRPQADRAGIRQTVAQFKESLNAADADLRRVARDLDASGKWFEAFEAEFDGTRYRMTPAASMLHVLTHGYYHRAQIVNMRRQLGLPALELALDVVEWELVQTGQSKTG